MELSERDRKIIAQRAAGSYAIIPQLRQIVTAHRKNRNLEDAPFLEFGRLVTKKSWSWDEYERLQRIVLGLFPHPFGVFPNAPAASPPKKKKAKKKRNPARKNSDGKSPPPKPKVRKPPAAGLLDLFGAD